MEWSWALGLAAAVAVGGLTWALRDARRRLAEAQGSAAAEAERRRDIFDGLDTGLVVWDPEDRLAVWNRDFERVYGPLSAELKVGLRFEDLLRIALRHGLVPEAAGREEAWIAERLAAHRHPGAPLLRRMASGRWRRITERFLPDGSLLSYSVDVTELVGQQQALEETRREAALAAARLEDAIEALPAAFELYDADDRVVLTNSRMREMYPRVAHLLPQRPHFETLVRANAALGGLPVPMSVDEWLADRLPQRRNPGAPRLVQTTDGRWCRLHERRTRDGGLVGVRIDVTEQVEREEQLQRLNAALDAANRRLAEVWPGALRHGLPLSLLLIDVDHFKRYNDHHGHPAGDACLRRVAELLQGCARRSDELLARYGGEQFVALLPHTTLAEAQAQAERCLAAVDAAAIPHGDSPLAAHVTLSIGVASVPAPTLAAADDPLALLRAADAALYRAKREGRRRVVAADQAER
jgi:diguanylate cyclase (GGDEF)-like protein